MPKPSAALKELRKRAAAARVPLHAMVEVTHRCNLRCRHCYLRDHHDPHGRAELTAAEFGDLLDQLAALQTLFLGLTGGEFFLREDACELLAAVRARGFVTTVLTNGTLIDRELARRIRECAPFQVHVSLLGPEEVHDRLAGVRGAWARALGAMDLLREAGVRVKAKLILTRRSAAHAEEMQRTARAHADDLVVSMDLIPGIDGAPAPAELQPAADDLAGMARSGDAPPRPRAARPPEGTVCGAGRSLLAVSPYGEILPCISFRRTIGSLREAKLAGLWNAPAMLEVASLSHAGLHDCRGCADRAYCSFCPGRGWLELGDMAGAAPSLCQRARRFRAAMGSPAP
jgi:radical SAM protein with 4Fe4S-binding SPASM domain